MLTKDTQLRVGRCPFGNDAPAMIDLVSAFKRVNILTNPRVSFF
jgi:hypothetical protein